MGRIGKFVGLAAFGLAAGAAFGQNLVELPIDPSVLNTANGKVGGWKMEWEPQAPYEPHMVAHTCTFLDQSLAGSLGFNYVHIGGGKDYSLLVAESRRFTTANCQIETDKGSFAGLAIYGVACRLSVLAKGDRLDVALGTEQAGIGVKVRSISETMNFLSVGFTTYHNFNLSLDQQNRLDLGSIRRDLIAVFNEYNKDASNMKLLRPQLLAIKVDKDDVDKIRNAKQVTIKN